MIIGITGTLGAGKGTVVEFLKEKGFNHFSARDFITQEIIKRNLPVNRDSMVLVGNSLRENNSPSYVAEQLFIQAQEKGGDCVIESLRTPGEINKLREKKDFVMFAVDADQKLRYQRAILRKSETDQISFEKFINQEKTEMETTDPNKQNLSKCISMADYVFQNDGTIDELNKQVEDALNKNNN